MVKVKIVQISSAMNNNDLVQEYLDSKGRVWYSVPLYRNDENGDRIKPYFEWKMVDLPEEPEQ